MVVSLVGFQGQVLLGGGGSSLMQCQRSGVPGMEHKPLTPWGQALYYEIPLKCWPLCLGWGFLKDYVLPLLKTYTALGTLPLNAGTN